MTDRQDTWAGILTAADRLAADIEATPMPEPPHDIDVIGRLRDVEKRLAAYRRTLEAEMNPDDVGADYKVEARRTATRSYNTPRLIVDFAREGVDLPDLVAADVVRVGWQWTNLRRVASAAGVTVNVAARELDPDDVDLDSPHVGETWKHQYRVVPKEDTP